MKKLTVKISANVWLYPGESAQWHFVTIPKKETTLINTQYGSLKRGWGSLPVEVTIGTTMWNTSIFPDKKSGTFILPLKAQIRRKEGIEAGDKIPLQILICP
jgi:hypothetical protein